MRYLILVAVLSGMPAAFADNIDCRNCHLYADPAHPAPEFIEFFNNMDKQHHPVGVTYPQQFGFSVEYNQPGGFAADVVFFDINHNGLPDANEVQLFGVGSSATVECSSCHIGHGTVARPPGAPPTYYLRVDNAKSALCMVCHRY
ncbi:MAG: hypothetical protein AB1513_01730 [Pseudomonadota bacterium]